MAAIYRLIGTLALHQQIKSANRDSTARQAQASGPVVFILFFCLIATFTTLLAPAPPARAAQNLPSMGEPADASLSPKAERELGEQFMRQVRASAPVIRDVQLVEYMQSLGERLASNIIPADPSRFEFFIINNPTINAFAIPGGFIGINSGLVDAMRVEDQLAAVVGHEIAHITQRHHARAVASNTRTRMTTAFAVLAAIIIGQSNPQAGQAALAAGLAATQQTMINFTRSNEYEADRIGIEILADAGYRPSAMAEAFDILRRKNSINTSSSQLEYLRTHPLDNTRIAEAKNRATALVRNQQNPSISGFSFFSARLHILTTPDRARAERSFRSQLNAVDTQSRDAARYALALLATDRQRYEEARKHLDGLDSVSRDNLFVQLLRAELLFAEGKATDSFSLLESLRGIYPESFAVVEIQFNKLVDSSRLRDAQLLILDYLRSTQNPDNVAWRELASIEQKLGNASASHEALSRYFSGLYNQPRAREQLQLAIRNVSEGSNDDLRLRARLRELGGARN